MSNYEQRSGEGDGAAFHEVVRPYTELSEVKISRTRMFNDKATMAYDMICRWGPVAAKTQEGELDNEGRSKIFSRTPGDLVAFAIETTDIAFDEFEKRGWIIPLPLPQRLEKPVEL